METYSAKKLQAQLLNGLMGNKMFNNPMVMKRMVFVDDMGDLSRFSYLPIKKETPTDTWFGRRNK